MFRRILLRLALPVLMAVLLLPVAFAQSQDSQSVAEAARRAKAQKKPPAKPARVITEDDVKTGSPANAAAPVPASAPAAPGASAQTSATPSASSGSSAEATKDGEKPKEPKEVTALREQIKQAASDLDLLQRQLRLDQDALYSKYEYKSDTAGIAKVDGEKQQVADKQQALDDLKAKLADLLKSLGMEDAASAPKP